MASQSAGITCAGHCAGQPLRPFGPSHFRQCRLYIRLTAFYTRSLCLSINGSTSALRTRAIEATPTVQTSEPINRAKNGINRCNKDNLQLKQRFQAGAPAGVSPHHVAVGLLRVKTICRSNFAQALLPSEAELPGPFSVGSYDHDDAVQHGNVHPLSENKARLLRAFDACGVPEDQRALMLAMAMQESTHLDVRERDASKDDMPDKSANATIFNLSVDLIIQTGYFSNIGPDGNLTQDQLRLLNTDSEEALAVAVDILRRAFANWGVENTLAFVRQGRSGFDPQRTSDWRSFVSGNATVSQHVVEYLRAIKTFLQYIDNQPNLFCDDHRPNIYTPWIGNTSG